MKYFITIALLCLSGKAFAQDTAAIQQCRALHHVDADATSHFMNSNCDLVCSIHGTQFNHFMNEGLQCPGVSTPNYVSYFTIEQTSLIE